jgi:hypothetical protein
MGEHTPSQFLRHLRRLAPDVPASLLRSIWTSRLPANVQATLVCHPDVSLDTAAEYADRIFETVPQPTLSLTTQTRHHSSSRDHRSSFRRRHSSPSRRHPYNGSPSRHDTADTFCWYHRRYGDGAQRCSQPCTYNRSPSRHDATTTSCWYHRRFGARAQNCIDPCAFCQQNKLAQQTSAAAHVCTTATCRLFVTDSRSKQQFLIITGSDLPQAHPTMQGKSQFRSQRC